MSAALEATARPRPRLFGVDARSAWAFLGYLALQGLVVIGLPTPRYPDSVTFTQLSFLGNAKMLPTVPLVYSALRVDTARLTFQAIFACIAWWVFAKVASELVHDQRVRLGLRLVLLALGLVGPIASWNSVLLSESIAISLTVLLFAAWLRYQQSPSYLRGGLALLVTLLWTFSRQALVSVSALLALVAVANALMHRRALLRWLMAAGLVAISSLGFVLVGHNRSFSMGVLSDIIEDRILVNSSYTSWYVAHGMPYSPEIKAAAGGAFGSALQNIPAMTKWIERHGTRTYVLFLLEHPTYTFIAPLASFSGEKASLLVPPSSVYPGIQPDPTPSLISPDANWGRHRQVLPSVVEDLLFEQGQIGDVLGLLGLSTLLVVYARRYRKGDGRLWVPGITAVSVIPQVYLTNLTGGVGELDRLAMVEAVCARISLWVIAAYALDALLEGRAVRAALAELDPAAL